MTDQLTPQKPSRSQRTANATVRLAPLAVFIVFLAILMYRFGAALSAPNGIDLLIAFGVLIGIIASAFAAAYGARFLLTDRPPDPTVNDVPGSALRDRLARQVVTIGSAGIAVIALFLIGAIAWSAKGDVSTSGLSIFTAILPVFSTWVGTVLAFYFTNESFRQAAESTQGLLRDNDADQPITRPGTMIPYDRIIRYELKPDQVNSASNDPIAAAKQIKLTEIRPLFVPPGVVRVVVFDDKKVPLYVLRHELMPAAAEDDAVLDSYLKTDSNADKAVNFSWTGRRATIADGRRLFEIKKVTDVFVTEHGRTDEPVLGWVPDENLIKPF